MISLDMILPLFTRYYNVETENVTEPFSARADFKSHNEQYVLVKSAHIADIDSNEHIFFATCDNLDEETLLDFHKKAWEQGQSMIEPYYGHKNTDISLVILAKNIPEESCKLIKKLRHSAVYKWGLYGYSNYRLLAVDCTMNKTFCNRKGDTLSSVVNNFIIKQYTIHKKEDEEV